MRLKLFGGFALTKNRSEIVPVSLRRGQALLAYLASKETRRESREVLLDMLWPDRFKEQAQASLRQVVFELKTLSPPGKPILVTSRNDVAFGPVIDDCDLWSFEESAAENQIDAAELLLGLYSGPFLDGPPLATEPFQQWTAIQRSRLENQLETSILAATAEYSNDAEVEKSLRLLARLVELCPMCFQALYRLMELSATRGNPAAAVRFYDHFARRLKLEFNEAPPPELSDFCNTLKTAPRQSVARYAPERQMAFIHKNPWTRARSDAPVVAVLPFRYTGTRGESAALTNAVCEDITLMLSGCRWLSVLSRSATHNIRSDEDFIPRDFARLTGANHLVYGTITDRADSLSLSIELADAETGYITWAKRYDATGQDLLTWAGEICPMIVSALDPALAESEYQALRKPALAATGSLIAYQHLVMGYRHYNAAQWPQAIAAFQRAIDDDATYAHAHAMLSVTTYMAAQISRDRGFDVELERAEHSARRALEIDPSEAKANIGLGQIMDWRGDHSESMGYLDRAMALNPSFAHASTARSYHAVMIGSFEAAKTYIQTAMRLRVGDAGLGFCLPSKALADFHLGNSKEALQTAHWAMRLTPDLWLCRMALAVALHANENFEPAGKLVDDLKRDYAGLNADEFASWFPYANPSDGDQITRALVQSGWR